MNTHTALLNSAEHLARTRGFDAFSYADLSREIGIRKASIHYHFPTKSDLALALVTRYRENFLAALPADGTAADRLSAYLHLYRAALGNGESLCLCVAFSAGRDSLSNHVIGVLDAFHSDSIAWLEVIFAAGRSDGTISGTADSASEAAACLALVEGAQLIARATKDTALFDRATKPLRSRLMPKESNK